MAQRLSTRYYLMELDISGQQLEEFVSMFKKNNFRTEVKVFENGDTELTLFDDDTEIPLAFINMGTFFKFEGCYTIKNWHLAHMMHRVVRYFKGNALVHRIYEKLEIEYQYKDGKVSQIIEHKNGQQRLIYKLNHVVDHLNYIFKERVIEDKIAWIYLQIDQLLDRRIQVNETMKNKIDQKLKKLCKELFILEG